MGISVGTNQPFQTWILPSYSVDMNWQTNDEGEGLEPFRATVGSPIQIK